MLSHEQRQLQYRPAGRFRQGFADEHDVVGVVRARPASWAEARVILLGASAHLDRAGERELATLAAGRLDWEIVVGLAVREGIAPLLHFHLRRLELLQRLPRPASLRLTAVATGAWATNAVREDRWAEATATLRQAGVEVITLKGTVLAQTVYPEPWVRPMADIDLLVRPADRAAALEVLRGLGYRTPGDEADRLAASRSFTELVRDGTLIDLHWHAARYLRFEGVVRVDHDGLWRRARPFVTPAGWSLTLCPEDLLLHLILHLTLGSEFGRVLWYADIDAVVRRYAAELDWGRLVAEAEHWRIRALVGFTLGIVRESFGTPLPGGLIERLRRGRARRAVVAGCIGARWPLSLRPRLRDTRVYLAQTLLMDRPADVLRVLVWTLFPSDTWLRLHYRIEVRWQVLIYRALHPLRVGWLAARQPR
jgi:Uncharacterised nucleotidyltransferase